MTRVLSAADLARIFEAGYHAAPAPGLEFQPYRHRDPARVTPERLAELEALDKADPDRDRPIPANARPANRNASRR